MTNPFETTVGLKSVTSGNPAVWVNDIAGIETELVSALSNADTPSAITVWQKVQRAGLDKLRSLVEGELSKTVDFRYISEKTGDLTGDASGVVVARPAYYGYQIGATVNLTDVLYQNTIALYSVSESDVTTTIKVINADGEILNSTSVTVKPGYNELLINYEVKPRFKSALNVFVGIDISGLSLQAVAEGQCWDTGNTLFSMTPASVPVSGSFASTNWVTEPVTTLRLLAMVRRNLFDVITRYADRLQWAYAYVCGSLLMAEKLGSSRVNLFTNTNREWSELKEAKFMDEATMLVKPVAREMIKELAAKQVVVDKTEQPFDPGYTQSGFV